MSLFKRPLAAVGFAGFFALVAAALLPFFAGVALAALCLLCGAILWWRRPLRKVAVCLFSAAVALSLFLLWTGTSRLPLQAFDGKTARVCGIVTKTDGVSHGVLTVTVRVTDGDLPRGTRVTVRVPFSDLAPAYGDTVKTTTALEYAASDGFFDNHRADCVFLSGWTAKATAFSLVRSDDRSLLKTVATARAAVAKALLSGMPRDVRPLLSAMCLGDKSDLSDEVTAAFRAAGVSHLLVVSGLHMSIVSMGVYGCLRKLRANRKFASAAALLALWAFALLIGAQPSVVRACVLNTLVLSGNLFRRRADGLNSLGGGLLLLWLCNPFCVYDVGLWLSFAATYGILRWFQPMEEACNAFLAKHSLGVFTRPARYVLESFCVTLAATLPILPICAVAFGKISLVTPLSNLLCVFAATLLLWCAAGALLLGVLPFGFLAGGLRLCATLAARYLLWATAFCGGLPNATFSTAALYRKVWVLLTVLAVILLWRFCGKRRALVGFACAVGVLVLLCVGETVLTKGQTEVTLKRAYGDNAVMLEQDGVICLLIDGGNGFSAAQRMVENENADTVETVVLLDTDRRFTRKWQEFNDSVAVGQYVLPVYSEKVLKALEQAGEDAAVVETTDVFQNGTVAFSDAAVTVTVGDEQFTIVTAEQAELPAQDDRVFTLTGTEDVSFVIS